MYELNDKRWLFSKQGSRFGFALTSTIPGAIPHQTSWLRLLYPKCLMIKMCQVMSYPWQWKSSIYGWLSHWPCAWVFPLPCLTTEMYIISIAPSFFGRNQSLFKYSSVHSNVQCCIPVLPWLSLVYPYRCKSGPIVFPFYCWLGPPYGLLLLTIWLNGGPLKSYI